MNTSRIAAAGCALGPLTYIGVASLMSVPGTAAGAGEGERREMIELTGVVRDFRERTDPHGHPDFERVPDHGFQHYMGNVAPMIGGDGRPVFTGEGYEVKHQWRDGAGRSICWNLAHQYPQVGDLAGRTGFPDTGGVESATSFAQWYRDTPGVNMSDLLTLTLVLQADGTYVFDDRLDPEYRLLGGFFPIEDRLFGNPGGTPNRNYHFTFELHGTFIYDADAGQIFKFIGDDEVYVFINGELVIDIGGVHTAVEQYVDLNRLGLADGDEYRLDFFFAERHRTESNFRIVTNLELESVEPTSLSAQFD